MTEQTPSTPRRLSVLRERPLPNCGIFKRAGAVLAAAAFLVVVYGAWGYAVQGRALVSGVIVLLLLRAHSLRWLGLWCLTLGVLACAYAPAGVLYGPPNANTLAALSGSNLGEAMEFLENLPNDVWWTECALVLTGGLLWRTSPCLPALHNKVSVGLLIVVLAVSAFSSLAKNWRKDIALHAQQVNVAEWRFVQAFYGAMTTRADSGLGNVFGAPAWGTVTRGAASPELSVLVIGESVRRDFMGAYNPTLNNTPWMSRVPGIDFTHYVSPYASTAGALSRVLFWSDAANKAAATNVVTLMQAAGYRAFWFSAQGDGEQLRSPASLAAWRAEEKHLPRRGLISERDEALLPRLEKALASTEKPRFIVLHLMGSHPRACRRTDGHYEKFVLSKELSCYIQSIGNTDKLLQHVAERLESTGRTWSLTYLADHGLRLDRDREGVALRQDDGDRMSYSPPFFFTASNLSERRKVEAARNGRYFLPIFARLNDLRVERFARRSCRWLEDVDCDDQTRVTDYEGRNRDYEGLSTTPLADL